MDSTLHIYHLHRFSKTMKWSRDHYSWGCMRDFMLPGWQTTLHVGPFHTDVPLSWHDC
jgi:hypothetical protein